MKRPLAASCHVAMNQGMGNALSVDLLMRLKMMLNAYQRTKYTMRRIFVFGTSVGWESETAVEQADISRGVIFEVSIFVKLPVLPFGLLLECRWLAARI